MKGQASERTEEGPRTEKRRKRPKVMAEPHLCAPPLWGEVQGLVSIGTQRWQETEPAWETHPGQRTPFLSGLPQGEELLFLHLRLHFPSCGLFLPFSLLPSLLPFTLSSISLPTPNPSCYTIPLPICQTRLHLVSVWAWEDQNTWVLKMARGGGDTSDP